MSKRLWVVAAAIGMLSSGSSLAAEQSADGIVQILARRIGATIAAQPSTSTAAVYQAQIASTLESDGGSCEIVQQALALSYGTATGEAQKAITRLRTAFANCRVGTGAVGGGGSLRFGGIGFSVGGGSSNYTN